MFGGQLYNSNTGTGGPSQETWEWSPTTGKWTNRTGTGTAPEARSGAAMAYDSARAKIVLFGGRAGSGLNFEDTWNGIPRPARGPTSRLRKPTSGALAACNGLRKVHEEDSPLRRRSQRPVVFRRHGNPVVARRHMGIGSSNANLDRTQASDHPSVRHDLGLVWDSTRNVAVLFAGMQIDIQGASGVPKRDTWEWNPTTRLGASELRPVASLASAMATPWPTMAAEPKWSCSAAGT